MVPHFDSDFSQRRALVWLAAFAFIGIALVILYPDAEQQDSGYHYLFARWAWNHPRYFVGVWARPLFTFIYSLPSQLGYPVAKLFTLLVCLITGWQTFRLAQDRHFDRAGLAVPFLFLQPAFFTLSPVVLTEPLFALFFIIGLRLNSSGRVRAGMFIASLLVLIRPEGFYIGILWGLWVLFDNRDPRAWWRRIPDTLILASGMILWWISACLITGDKLWIMHEWPSEWHANGNTSGVLAILWYLVLLPLIVGPLLLAPFVIGLIKLLRRRELIFATSSFLALFILHSLMYARGWFGSTGYARYLVCVSPAIALITLYGWNRISVWYRQWRSHALPSPVSAGVLTLSLLFCLLYYDGWPYTRDAGAVEEMHYWFRSNERPISRLICSQAYMRIIFDRDLWEDPYFGSDRERNLDIVRQSPTQTLVLWDEDTGPKWFHLRAEDFEAAGYVRLKYRSFRLKGRLFTLARKGYGGARTQQMHLFYKD